MKKLALALMCLVSVAFFASCNPEGQPTIQVLEQEGYVQDSAFVELGQEVQFGFVVASSATTNKELTSLVVKVDDTEWANVDLTGKTEYTYTDVVTYTAERNEVVGTSVITAVVTDAAGQIATATINLSITQEDNLVETAFTWNRHGGDDATGLDAFGLKWTKNERAIYAVIEPVEGAILYQFDPSTWSETTTATQKTALFETAISVSQWKEFNVAGAVDQTLDVVLGTSYNNELHLLHITNGHIETFKGTDVTLTGMAK